MTDTIEQVGDIDPTKETSPIVEGEPEPEDASKRALCYFNGVAYSTGAYVCSSGTRLFCNSSGTWSSAGSC
jgi:hypothetical protein